MGSSVDQWRLRDHAFPHTLPHTLAGTDALLRGQTGALAGTGRIAGRFFGGGLGGAVAAPLVTAALMGLSSEHYTGIDYAAKMGRSAVQLRQSGRS